LLRDLKRKEKKETGRGGGCSGNENDRTGSHIGSPQITKKNDDEYKKEQKGLKKKFRFLD